MKQGGALLALLAFAFLFCFKAGERGFFSLDQSIEFDGAYRVLSGQVVYRDFVIPTGPVVHWLQALFFWLGGVDYGSYLVGAAVINALAAGLGFRLASLLFPGQLWLALTAGGLTAIWFYSVFGTPNMEQTSFFFSLLGITLAVNAVRGGSMTGLSRLVQIGLAGGCAVTAFLSKQNAGLFIVPVYALVPLVALSNRKQFVWAGVAFLAGAVVTAGAFAAWLYLYSNPDHFYRHFWVIPAGMGRSRLAENGLNVLGQFFGLRIKARDPIHTSIFAATVVGALWSWAAWRRRASESSPDIPARLAAALCVFLPFFQGAFAQTTSNQWSECMPFLGIILACAAGLLLQMLHNERASLDPPPNPAATLSWRAAACWLAAGIVAADVGGAVFPAAAVAIVLGVAALLGWIETPRAAAEGAGPEAKRSWNPRRQTLARTLLTLAIAACAIQGMRIAWSRNVHDIFSRKTHFGDRTNIPGLTQLRWGQPTPVKSVTIEEQEVAQLVELLREEQKPFFVFPDFTILYGLLGQPSPQPLLWFHKGLTYPEEYDETLDRWIVESLKARNVELVVLQEDSWFGTSAELLDDFPRLYQMIDEEFELLKVIGSFEVRKRAAGARDVPARTEDRE
ncbi:MAG: ArnT family glycosyltransferase [Planctomycetales bacterium]